MADERFPKSDRILSPRDFRWVYEQGRRYHSPSFVAFVLETQGENSRIGLTVTRKFGKAVERNRAKRLLREAFRHCKSDEGKKFDIVFNLRRSVLARGVTELQQEVSGLLQRINQQWLRS